MKSLLFFIGFLTIGICQPSIQTLSPGAPINFSHRLHVWDQLIRCTKCHNPKLLKSSTTSKDVILPTEKRCLKCHSKWKDENQCSKCHMYEPYEPFGMEDRIFDFPHKTHYVDNNIECVTCHSDMEFSYNKVPIPTMKQCLDCHQKKGAPTYCEACHQQIVYLRPADHNMTWMRDHGVAAFNKTNDCQMCHSRLSCDNCHSGANLGHDDLTETNPEPQYRPDMFTGNQLIARNHDLNYVYFHGLDATTKSAECRVCHESSEFCSNCHQNSHQMLLNKPDFHDGLEWGAVEYQPGTDFASINGGGTHAKMAKRDIELCQSCHDLDGGDPICVQCHVDNDGIRNTDPKTHAAGYMQNTRGDWCTEPVSMCFVCHKPQNKGVGFCGYCHL